MTTATAFSLDRDKFRAALAEHADERGLDLELDTLTPGDYASEEYALDTISDGIGALLDIAVDGDAVGGDQELTPIAYAINGAYTHSLAVMVEHRDSGLRITGQSINALELHPDLHRNHEPAGFENACVMVENTLTAAAQLLADFRANAAAFGV